MLKRQFSKPKPALRSSEQHKSMSNIYSHKPSCAERWYVWRKTWMIMRLTILLIIISTLTISAKSYSQKVTLSLRNVPIQSVFTHIREQTGCSFLWAEETLKGLPSVTVSIHSANLTEAIQVALNGLPLTYDIHGNVVYIERQVIPPLYINPNTERPVMPQHEISGEVVDATTGGPLIGVTIRVKGSSVGTTTDVNGKFSLNVPDNSVLQVSFLGYTSKEISVNGMSNIQIKLSVSTTGLNQLVVVGYGTEKKADLTGAVDVVDMKKLKNFPQSDVSEMLKGQAAGVTVNNDYSPGGSVAVRIRGFSTIGNNDPLYIIDGVPTTGSSLNTLDPNDIASIQVLKDASSASIYGSRAANGVIIITTKEGSVGKPKISFDSYTGIQNVFHLPVMLNAQQYGNMLWQAMKNDGMTPANAVYGNGPTPVIPTQLGGPNQVQTEIPGDVNWMKELFHTALIQSYNLSISKGTDDSHQYFSVGYYDQQGTMKYTGFKRITARMNTDTRIFNRLKIGENFTVAYTNTINIGNDNVNGGLIYDAIKFPSIAPVYDINGNFGGSPLNDAWNPLGALWRNRNNMQKNMNLFGNTYAELSILKGLELKTNIGINYTNFNYRDYSPKYMELGTGQPESNLTTSNTFNYNLVWSNTAEYKKSFKNQSFDLLAGTEAVKYYEEDFSASRVGFPSDDPNFQYLNGGSGTNQTNTGTGFQWSLLSFFGKLNYNYKDRYLLSATLRRDGSSKLGNNQWGNFPAVSAGWRISQEPFYHIKPINDLKLRFGWGQNGNQDIPPYSSIESYVSDPNNSNYPINGSTSSVQTGYIQSRVANPNLKWETTTQSDFGIDFSLFNSALQGSVDYFIKNTKDMLLQRPLPPQMGGTTQSFWDNAGTMSNKGIDIGLSYSHTVNELSFTLSGNVSAYKNRITSLPADVPFITLPASTLHGINFDQVVTQSAAGEPIGEFYGYKVLGIFQNASQIEKYQMQPNAQPGDLIFADVNKDGVIDANDRTYIGSPLPKFTYGFNADLKWKQFDFSFFIQGSYGNKIYDLTRYYGDFFNLSAYNKNARVLEAWSPNNTNTSVPRLSLNDPNNNIRPSSYFVQNGSYARLKNVQLGYTFSEKIIHGNFRVYLMAENLITITRYAGMNPEVGMQSYSSGNQYENLDIGVDRGLYPPSRISAVGINLNF